MVKNLVEFTLITGFLQVLLKLRAEKNKERITERSTAFSTPNKNICYIRGVYLYRGGRDASVNVDIERTD